MCILCQIDNPFDIGDAEKLSLDIKRARVLILKAAIKSWDPNQLCDDGKEKIKEAQYIFSRYL